MFTNFKPILCTVLFECILLSGVCFLPDSKFVLRIDVLLLREPKKYKFIRFITSRRNTVPYNKHRILEYTRIFK